MPQITWLQVDKKYRILHVRLAKNFNKNPSDFLGKSLLEIVSYVIRVEIMKAIEQVIASGEIIEIIFPFFKNNDQLYISRITKNNDTTANIYIVAERHMIKTLSQSFKKKRQ